MAATTDLHTCCTLSYGHPLARWLLGDSLHPGGLALTTRLAHLSGVGPSSHVLDAGSGLGASAVRLAQTVGCRVTGVTLEEEGVLAGYGLARLHSVEGLVNFLQGDVRKVELSPKSFDVVLLECVLSILQDKADVLQRLSDFLRPGGRLGLTDVTVSGPLPPELQGVLATVGCVGGALSLREYGVLLEQQGLVVEHMEDCGTVVSSFLRDIRGRVLMAEVALKLGKLKLSGGALEEGKRLLALVEEQVQLGVLGYGMVTALKPG